MKKLLLSLGVVFVISPILYAVHKEKAQNHSRTFLGGFEELHLPKKNAKM